MERQHHCCVLFSCEFCSFSKAWPSESKICSEKGGILKFYSDDAPGLKVSPTTVTRGSWWKQADLTC